MEFIKEWIDFILHFDKHLEQFLTHYGTWTYVILIGIIFAETGLVIMPFLPGDSLLFAAGIFAGKFPDLLNVWVLLVTLSLAGILGDTVNYWIGYHFGKEHIVKRIPFVNMSHIEKTQKFYEKHGGKTIVLARFIPIIRTFAPFVAGVGKMNYSMFIFYNIIGGILWVGIFLLLGYCLGNVTFVQKNFKLVVIVIILGSVIPIIWEYLAHRNRKAIASTNLLPEDQTKTP